MPRARPRPKQLEQNRARNPPAARDEQTLRTCARQLGLKPGTEDWLKFFDYAAVDAGRIPDDILKDQNLIAHLPTFFRTLSGQKSDRAKRGQPVCPPPVGRPERLPLGDANISWDKFEAFCRAFVSQLDGVLDCYHYGKQGSKQKGIDLVAELQSKARWTFQCRQWRKFSKHDAQKTVSETTFQAARHVILVSCEVDTSVRDFIRQHTNWELWDVRDISHRVRQLAAEKARRLIDENFGPNWRKLFLGLGPLSPFLSPESYFAEWLRPERLFNHSWTLVGRTDLLRELNDFTASPNSRVGVLPGRGGIGKSKLLHSFSESLEAKHTEHLLWFVQEGVPLTTETLDELPVAPLLVVVDDAHRRDDLALLLAHARRANHPIKLLFALRPQGIATVRSLLSRTGYDTTEITTFPELKQLGREDVHSLAAQALGESAKHLVERLAAATRDCPLVTVVGGRLLAQKAIDPLLLEQNDEFQRTVLDRFEDEIVGRVGADDSILCRELLKLTSATAPISAQDDRFIQTAAGFLSSTPDRLISALGQLENIGVLLRRGRSLRITPDVLADHILAKACIAANGLPTGYAEQVFQRFADSRPARVLKNLAELDWRVERMSGRSANLLPQIWRDLEQKFRDADAFVRCQILDTVKEAAFFQPGQAFRIVEVAAKLAPKRLAKKKKRKTVDFFEVGEPDALDRLPEILRNIAFNREFLPDCCHLLWALGRSDNRPPHQFPHHPIRVLQDLASYEPSKPIGFNGLILDCVVEWLRDPKLHEHAHSPLCILDKLLERSGDTTRMEGAMVVVKPFLVSPERTKPIRQRALDALRACAQSKDMKPLMEVLGTLRDLLYDNFGMARDSATPEYLNGWLPEKLQVLNEIEQIAKTSRNPLIHWKALDLLDWPSQRDQSAEIRNRASAIIERIPISLELRLILSLLSEPLLPRRRRHSRSENDRDKEMDEEEANRVKFRASVADECVLTFRRADRLFRILDFWLREMESARCSTWPQHLLAAIAERHSKLGHGLCKAILKSHDSPLAPYFHVLLFALRKYPQRTLSSLLERASHTKSSKLRFSVAHHFWFANREKAPQGNDLKVLRRLIRHPDVNASRLAIESLEYLGKHDMNLALALVFEADIEGHTAKAAAAFGCFDAEHGIDPGRLTSPQVKDLLSRLTTVPDIEDHWIQEFLSFAASREPLAVVELFIRRIRNRASRNDIDYRPIPFRVAASLEAIAAHPDYVKVLRRVRNLAMQRSWHFSYFTSDLFWMISSDGRGVEVLREWIESKDPKRIVAAARFLEKAGRDFVFVDPDYVTLVLENASAANDDCYRSVSAYLDSSATSGSRSGTVGEPMPRDVEIRDKARGLAKRFEAKPIVRRFYEGLAHGAEENIRRDREEYEETFDAD